MPISGQAKDTLKQLAVCMIQEPQALADSSLAEGLMHRVFPERLRGAVGGGWLVLTGDGYRLYREAVEALSHEKEMEHLSRRDVDDELWDFACDLFVHRAEYRNDMARTKAIRKLADRLRRPWEHYEVMAIVENVRSRVRGLHVTDITIRYLSRKSALEWGFGGSLTWNEYGKPFIGRVVAIVPERAGSPQLAAERAIEKIDDGLHALRIALVCSFMVSIPDEQMLFARGQLLAVKEVTTGEIKCIRWQRRFHPTELEIRRRTAGSLGKYLASINAVIERDTPEPIQNQLRRALHWIGSSITRESLDDKVVDLCTALETLLTVRSDAKKGEAIALRTMLLPIALGEGFLSPFEVYELYQLRSRIIHGSDLRVCGRHHYSHLLSLATYAVDLFVRLVTRDRSITRPANVIAVIEAPDVLSRAIGWLEGVQGEDSRKIAAFAQARMGGTGLRCRQ